MGLDTLFGRLFGRIGTETSGEAERAARCFAPPKAAE